jgi:hypothetical protein
MYGSRPTTALGAHSSYSLTHYLDQLLHLEPTHHTHSHTI